jgi:hypothetical protein
VDDCLVLVEEFCHFLLLVRVAQDKFKESGVALVVVMFFEQFGLGVFGVAEDAGTEVGLEGFDEGTLLGFDEGEGGEVGEEGSVAYDVLVLESGHFCLFFY